ncbi:MAG: phage tail protein [Propionivibrio sp.]
MSVFTWQPAAGASLSCKPAVDVAKLGDGYEQRTAAGLNNQLRQWSLRFTGDVFEVLDFIEQRNGETSFTWTDPLGKTGTFVLPRMEGQSRWRGSVLGQLRF